MASASNAVPTQADWNAADEGVLNQLRAVARTMIVSVAKTGSSHYNADVLAFQRQWNVSKPTIVKALAIIKGWQISYAVQFFVSLKEDGGYGKHTGGALTMLLSPGPKPPLTASGMTLYYANNAPFVDGLAPSRPAVIPPVLQHPGTMSTSAPHPAAATIAASGTYVPKVVKPASTSKVVVTKKTASQSAPTAASKIRSPLPPATVPKMSQQAQVLDFTQDPTPTTVVATPTGTDYKLIAVGIGGVALGGVLFWMLKKKAA